MDCCSADVTLVVNGNEQTLTHFHEDGLLQGDCPRGWPIDRLRFEVRGNTYTAILNGAVMHAVQDNTFGRGRAGIGAIRDQDYDPGILIDNFRVTALN
jgi:hypothetical protein